uniref:Galactose-1-phosphate uridylyltransferase n=1 Tax=Lygus hesperus TaxID=30085 RepID=A0A0A9ZEF4_LYGHE
MNLSTLHVAFNYDLCAQGPMHQIEEDMMDHNKTTSSTLIKIRALDTMIVTINLTITANTQVPMNRVSIEQNLMATGAEEEIETGAAIFFVAHPLINGKTHTFIDKASMVGEIMNTATIMPSQVKALVITHIIILMAALRNTDEAVGIDIIMSEVVAVAVAVAMTLNAISINLSQPHIQTKSITKTTS